MNFKASMAMLLRLFFVLGFSTTFIFAFAAMACARTDLGQIG